MLRLRCFPQRRRCNNNLITFLLVTSSAHSVEQLPQCLAAAYRSPPSPLCFCSNQIITHATITCQRMRASSVSSEHAGTLTEARYVTEGGGRRSDLTEPSGCSVLAAWHGMTTVHKTIDQIAPLSFKDAVYRLARTACVPFKSYIKLPERS